MFLNVFKIFSQNHKRELEWMSLHWLAGNEILSIVDFSESLFVTANGPLRILRILSKTCKKYVDRRKKCCESLFTQFHSQKWKTDLWCTNSPLTIETSYFPHFHSHTSYETHFCISPSFVDFWVSRILCTMCAFLLSWCGFRISILKRSKYNRFHHGH